MRFSGESPNDFHPSCLSPRPSPLPISSSNQLVVDFVQCSNQVLATPQGLTLLGYEISHNVGFWWYNSGWAAKYNAWFPHDTKGWDGEGAPPHTPPAPSVQEKQADGDRKVARLEISPRDVTIHTGEKVVFAALAYDKDGQMVSGVKFTWDGSDEEKKRKMSVSPRGVFSSGRSSP